MIDIELKSKNYIADKMATVVLLKRDNKYCLAIKKQPIHTDDKVLKDSENIYNGYGGKKDSDDKTISDTAIRELYEETGGVVSNKDDLQLKCVLNSFWDKGEIKDLKRPTMQVYFYVLEKWINDPKETDEMGQPEWFSIDDIPLNKMTTDNVFFFKQMLLQNNVLECVFVKNQNKFYFL